MDNLYVGTLADSDADRGQQRLLTTLEQLLTIKSTGVQSALDQASDLLAVALSADKIDAFLYDPSTNTLIAAGSSRTPMARRQHKIGMDRLPIVNGGRMVEVFQTGKSYLTGHADQDPGVLAGFRRGLGVRSMMAAAFEVDEERRGILQAASAQEDLFGSDDLRFLEAAARWIGMLTHRAELVERIAHDVAERAKRAAAEEIVTVLAHDLNNHLTPLAGRLDLIHRRARREGRERDIQDSQAAALALNRLRGLINDLLDIGRLDQGLFSISPQPVDLVALAQETVGIMQTGRLNILLQAPEEVTAEVDPARIRQAIENLLSNALKHSPDGVPVELLLECETRQDGDWAVISVRDQGPGLPPELRKKLFTRFASRPNSTGLVIGLYLSRSIVEAHDGAITVDSLAVQRATFRLLLPDSPYH